MRLQYLRKRRQRYRDYGRTTGGTQQTLTDTTLTSLYGNTYTNSTSGNTVSISGEGTAVTLAGETVSGGSKTSGILAGAYTTEAGDASNNTLSVTDGASVTFSSSYAGVAGGASMNGAASDNQVTLSGAFLSVPDGNSLDITGGVSGASAADNNVVTLTDLTSSTENQSVTGGESRALTEPATVPVLTAHRTTVSRFRPLRKQPMQTSPAGVPQEMPMATWYP